MKINGYPARIPGMINHLYMFSINLSRGIRNYFRQWPDNHKVIIFFVVFFVFAGNYLHAIGVSSDSLKFKYPETARIIREHTSPIHKLKKADRKILKKEISFQYNRIKKRDDAKLNVHRFFLVLSLIAIFLGSLFLAFAFAYGGQNALAVIMILLGIGAFVVVLYFGIKKSKKLKKAAGG